MDVNWTRQKINNQTSGSGINLVAVLVGDDQKEGRVNNQFSTQLGSIGEKFLNSKARDMRAFHQGLFWVHVDRNLNRLSLKPQERHRIEAIISKTVPRPDTDWALWSVTCIPRYDP